MARQTHFQDDQKSHWLVKLVWLIVLAALLCGTFLFIQNRDPGFVGSVQMEWQIFSENLRLDLSAGWKTYTNPKWGYSISYTADYTPSTDGEGITAVNKNLPTDSTLAVEIEQESARARLNGSGQAYDLTQPDQQREFIQWLDPRADVKAETFGKVTWFALDTATDANPSSVYYAFNPDGDTYYSILVWNADADPVVLQHMLSSFSF
jgi:hypothetical protein